MGLLEQLQEERRERAVDRVVREADTTDWLHDLAAVDLGEALPNRGGIVRGGHAHGWLGCCLAHDTEQQHQADLAGDDAVGFRACDECAAACPPGVGRPHEDDPQSFLCPTCAGIADEETAAAARAEDYDWLNER